MKMHKSMTQPKRNFVALAERLEKVLCEQYPALRERRANGLIVVAVARPRFYFHTDRGVTSSSYDDVVAALAAPKLKLTILVGVQPD